jgi:hypothetical protein
VAASGDDRATTIFGAGGGSRKQSATERLENAARVIASRSHSFDGQPLAYTEPDETEKPERRDTVKTRHARLRELGVTWLVLCFFASPAAGAVLAQCAISAIDTSRPSGTSGITLDSRGFPEFIALDWFDGEPDPTAIYARLPNQSHKYTPLWRPGDLVPAKIVSRTRRDEEASRETVGFARDFTAALMAVAPVTVIGADRHAQTMIRLEPRVTAGLGAALEASVRVRIQHFAAVCMFPGSNAVKMTGQTDERTFEAEGVSTRMCAEMIATAVAAWLRQPFDRFHERLHR